MLHDIIGEQIFERLRATGSQRLDQGLLLCCDLRRERRGRLTLNSHVSGLV
jgi:hypothetical protein